MVRGVCARCELGTCTERHDRAHGGCQKTGDCKCEETSLTLEITRLKEPAQESQPLLHQSPVAVAGADGHLQRNASTGPPPPAAQCTGLPEEHEFDESMWDLAFLVGLTQGRADTLLICVVLCVLCGFNLLCSIFPLYRDSELHD